MIPVFPIKQEAKVHIQNQICDLAARNDVQILLAIESGSRAWGFPSEDSDYDVRFIYVRPREDYLSVQEFRDVIETPLQQDAVLGVPLDFNGWDVRKALQLAIKSNPVLIEWLGSPVKYGVQAAAVERLLAFARKAANMKAFHYHYYRLAQNAWEQIQQNAEKVKCKVYCYALRPVLASQWILHYKQPPPMDIASLCKGLIGEGALLEQIEHLIRIKVKAQEGDLVSRIPILDSHIATVLSHKAERSQGSADPSLWQEADQLFRSLLV